MHVVEMWQHLTSAAHELTTNANISLLTTHPN